VGEHEEKPEEIGNTKMRVVGGSHVVKMQMIEEFKGERRLGKDDSRGGIGEVGGVGNG